MIRSKALIMLLLIHYSLLLPLYVRGVLAKNSVVKFVVTVACSFCSHVAEKKRQKTDCLTLNAFLLSFGYLCFVSRPNSEHGISGNTCFLIQIEKQTNLWTDIQIDR